MFINFPLSTSRFVCGRAAVFASRSAISSHRSSVHERERLEAEKHGLQEILESFRTGAERQKKKEWQKEKDLGTGES